MSKAFKEETLNIVFEQVTMLINNNMLHIPADYSVANALRHAWFVISETKGNEKAGYKLAPEICTVESIANCLLKMVTDGLTPAKSQCSFIIRKEGANYELNYEHEYQGKIALAKRYGGVQRVDAEVIYEGDEYVTEIVDGVKKVVKHIQPIENINLDKVKGAYAVVTEKDGTKKVFEMNIVQIKKSWALGAMKGTGDVHKDFADEMAKKTVVNRACKGYINTSNDESVLPALPELNDEQKQSLQLGNIEQKKLTLSIEPEPEKPEPKTKPEKQTKKTEPDVKPEPSDDNPY
jgi:recombination protein RecT